MTIELIKEGKNGQMEIDFESLEAATSAEMVRMVKTCIETHKNKNQADSISIKLLKGDSGLISFKLILIINYACYYIYALDFGNGDSLKYSKDMIPYGIIEQIVEMAGEK